MARLSHSHAGRVGIVVPRRRWHSAGDVTASTQSGAGPVAIFTGPWPSATSGLARAVPGVQALVPLTSQQRKHLRGLSHALAPVVMVGQRGLTPAVLAEIEAALEQHELIKVKLRADRGARATWIESIGASTGAEVVQNVGQTACFYRRHPEQPRIQLPSRPAAT